MGISNNSSGEEKKNSLSDGVDLFMNINEIKLERTNSEKTSVSRFKSNVNVNIEEKNFKNEMESMLTSRKMKTNKNIENLNAYDK